MAGGLFVYRSSNNGVLGSKSAAGGTADPASVAALGDLCSEGAVPIYTAQR